MSGFTDVAAKTVNQWLADGEAVVIDVREAEELIQARLADAVHVPLSAFNPDLVPTDTGKKVVFLCAIGQRSAQAGTYMVDQGLLDEAFNLAGGIQAWAAAGLPYDSGPAG
jgi:rhodanese-related sulfurtransferase